MQATFSDLEWAAKKKVIRRDRFLGETLTQFGLANLLMAKRRIFVLHAQGAS